jgi:hypothetical protein
MVCLQNDARLPFCDEICWEYPTELLRVVHVPRCVRHGTRFKPAIEYFFYSLEGSLALLARYGQVVLIFQCE